ncbi:UNVERIFIED_CONTAM: hypothetical protein Slati_0834000 [Sesamum latifolium]|uniref:Endonuclease/exonuclease/phosphatase domain-containing protein n=1 Tax=Sesamum latifolium TaxID=2727402 RepID=A0AAW2XLG7_9LAMI
MKLLAWNCQGLGPAWTVRTLLELIKLHRPTLVFLSETKCKQRRCDLLKERTNYYGVAVDSCGKGGGLMLLWRKDIEVCLQSFSKHHIDATVSLNGDSQNWRFTGFYGHPDTASRKGTWDLLRKLSRCATRPWLCAGDYNEILSQNEKEGLIPVLNGKSRILGDAWKIVGYKIWILWAIRSHSVTIMKNRTRCEHDWIADVVIRGGRNYFLPHGFNMFERQLQII